MEPLEIRILLKRARVTILSLSEKLGVTDSMIHQVIDGQRHTEYVRQAIAEATGKPVEKLWPQTNNKKKAA